MSKWSKEYKRDYNRRWMAKSRRVKKFTRWDFIVMRYLPGLKICPR